LAKGRNPIHPKKQLHQMNKIFKNTIAIFILLFSSNVLVGQQHHLQLGILSTFDAYTGTGAVTNHGTLINDVGTNNGVVSGTGFNTAYNGTVYNNDSTTVQSRIDLLRVYIHLSKIFVTHAGTHAPAFGGGETLTPGVYSLPGAGTIAGNLTLNGGGDPNAVFIFKFDGAFTAGVSSTVILSGNTRACNVYWIAEGAVAIGASSTMKGTLFSHPGSVSVGANCDIDGRLLSTEGAITLGSGSTASAPNGSITIPISYSSNRATATAVDVLGSIEDYAMFSSDGDVSNAATSGFIGDIGTDSGLITGYTTSPVIGDTSNANSTTQQAKLDLDSAYLKLIDIAITDSSHTPAFGSGETITPGVYYIGGAGSLAGTITLNGQNDSDAIFVLRFNGAFSVAAQAKVILDSGTRICNVFWIAEGALSMGTFTYMKGTVLAHGGACSMAANGNIEGRMLSTYGAVSSSTGVIYIEPLYFPTVAPPALPIKLLSFTAEAVADNVELNWVTASEINNNYFNVEYSRDGYSFTSIIKRTGAGNSAENTRYTAVHNTSEDGTLYYRLKQTDFDGTSSYSDIVAVDLSADKGVTFNISPNPMHIQATITTSENLKNASLIVYNSHMMVKQINNISGRSFTFQREELRKGLYWISLVQDGQVIETKKIVLTD
jgi:hypothetical protein